jgi:adenylate cyclase
MQLKLFTGQKKHIRKSSLSKRHSQNRKPSISRQAGWDLWTQETELEQDMALFFLDIRNFTALAEVHSPSNVIHIIRKLFSVFQNIIRIHHGRIIETSGDGFYAAFGFDTEIKQAVHAAVKSGMSILENLENLNKRSFEKNLHRKIEVGIGLHVGKVATGNIQLGAKDHMIVMGYPVNIASRIQTATKELNNNFIVSSTAHQLLDNPAGNTLTANVNLKGVPNPYELHLIGKPYKIKELFN